MTPISKKVNQVRGSPSSVLHTPSTTVPPIDIESEESWVCPASEKSLRTTNPIRAIVDPIVASSLGGERSDGKDHISLALGDPTVSGHLPTCPVVIDAVVKAVNTPGNAAGYVNALGKPEARAAIAKHHHVDADQVIIANGCSGALELALTALLDPGTVLLVPKPGFPLYQVIAESHGASVAHYNLLHDQEWECDLQHIHELVHQYLPGTVRGIVVNNPSNPTGSVYSEQHLEAIVHTARTLQLPLVADEVYGQLTFANRKFHPLAQVAANLGHHVPVITASGLAKQYLLPGWRVGWIAFNDSHNGALREVEAGAKRLAQVILGASHLAQTVVPALLDPTSQTDRDAIAEWRMELKSTLEQQAKAVCDGLAECHGLSVRLPQGAMYAMVEIDTARLDIQDDMDFTKLLLKEENVFVLPGRAFGVDSSQYSVFRVVFCASVDMLREAAQRISNFCARHAK